MAGKKNEEKAVGVSKGGRNTKIHALVDGLGNPLAFLHMSLQMVFLPIFENAMQSA